MAGSCHPEAIAFSLFCTSGLVWSDRILVESISNDMVCECVGASAADSAGFSVAFICARPLFVRALIRPLSRLICCFDSLVIVIHSST